MRVLVTGGAGFIGGTVTRLLLAGGPDGSWALRFAGQRDRGRVSQSGKAAATGRRLAAGMRLEVPYRPPGFG